MLVLFLFMLPSDASFSFQPECLDEVTRLDDVCSCRRIGYARPMTGELNDERAKIPSLIIQSSAVVLGAMAMSMGGPN